PIAARLWVARLVLIGGLLLPLWPSWWAAPWPQRSGASSVGVVRQEVAGGPANLAEGDAANLQAPAGTMVDPRPGTTPTAETRTNGLTAFIAVVDWRVLAAWAWLACCSLLLARQAAGWWWLTRVRRAASPIDGALLHELQAVRDELGI